MRVADLAHGGRRQVHGVFRHSIGRQQLFDLRLRRGIEWNDLKTLRDQHVRQPDRAAARIADNGDAPARRQFAIGKCRRRIDHLVEIAALDDAVFAEQRIKDARLSRHRTGVRCRRVPARLRAAGFGRDHRFAGNGRLLQRRPQFRRIAHAFQIKQEHIGAAPLQQVMQVISSLETAFVAAADHKAVGNLPLLADIEKGESEAAALRNHRDAFADVDFGIERDRDVFQRRAERCRDFFEIVNEALGIRAAHCHVVTPRNFLQLDFTQAAVIATLFGKAGGNDEHGADTRFSALLDELRHRLGRRGENDEIDDFRHFFKRRERAAAAHLFQAAAHQVQRSVEAAMQQHLQQPAADGFRVFRHAHNRNAAGRQKSLQICHAVIFLVCCAGGPPATCARRRAATRRPWRRTGSSSRTSARRGKWVH